MRGIDVKGWGVQVGSAMLVVSEGRGGGGGVGGRSVGKSDVSSGS